MTNTTPSTSEISSAGNVPESAEKTDFLVSAIATPKEELKIIGNCTEKEMVLGEIQISEDIKTLTKTELNEKYSLEYKRHDNMKQRRKKGAVIDPRFEVFSDFLRYMGAIPSKDYTLDRIDNDDPTYSPENCRWADKYTQNSNKGNNVYVTYKSETKTIAQWAKITSQKPSTLYMRKNNGWSDDEIVTGDREQDVNDPWRNTPWPIGRELAWESYYQRSVIAGKDINRQEFLYITAKDKLEKANYNLMECEPELDHYGNNDKYNHLVSEVERWGKIFSYSQKRMEYQRNRKAFTQRNNSLGHFQEAVLFDLVNGDSPFDTTPEI
jgi:hypothetical protein